MFTTRGPRMRLITITGLALALALAACGGGDDGDQRGGRTATPTAATADPLGTTPGAADPPRRSVLALGRRLDATAILDWAERAYPQYFPGSQPNQHLDPYVYRHYPASQTYAGVAQDRVYVLGPLSGGQLLDVGSVADFACALYPIDCQPSPLIGRRWQPAQALETGDVSTRGFRAGIDDQGRTTVIFIRSDGTRERLYAVHGRAAEGAAAGAWTAPVPIDAAASTGLVPLSNRRITLSVGAGGVAVATWVSRGLCTASSYRKSGNCDYLYAARFDPALGAWSPPLQLADTPHADSASTFVQRPAISAAGDFAIVHEGWRPSTASSGYSAATVVAWLPRQSVQPRRQAFAETSFSFDVRIDRDGRMVVAAAAEQNATTDLVVYRGTQADGFAAAERLESRSARVSLGELARGLDGQTVVTWRQDNGGGASNFAATLAAADGAWSVADLGTAFNGTTLLVTDDGDALWYRMENCTLRRWSAGAWSGVQSLPPACASTNLHGELAFNRNGDVLSLDADGGTATYDARTNTMLSRFPATSPGPGFLLGLAKRNPGTHWAGLSAGGSAVFITEAAYDVLPSPAMPSGDGRSAVDNLWGIYFH